MATKRCQECGSPLRTKPRFATRPTPRARTYQRDIWRSAEQLGTPLLPWQRGAARLLGELEPGGLPRFSTVVVSVPRQQGKTVLGRASVQTRAEREDRQEIYGTAQSRQYAAKHVVRLGEALTLAGERVKVLKGVGAESVTWPNGSTYMPISPIEGGGHGDSIDFMQVDEGWKLSSTTLGGIRPAMIARPFAQMLIISTMGTVESHVWNAIVADGREAINDPDSDVAYIEYSAATDEAVWDESTWHDYMPSLGHTVTHRAVRAAIRDLEKAEGQSEVIRAFGNRTTKAIVAVFPTDDVEAAWKVVEPSESMVLAIDVNDEPPGATISAGYGTEEEGVALRVLEWRFGSGDWIPETIETIARMRKIEAVVGDFGGPARSIHAELKRVCNDRFITLVERGSKDVQADHKNFYDGLRDRHVAMEKSPQLEESITGARRKNLGDMWVVHRRGMMVDASPTISIILAYGMVHELAVNPPAKPAIYWG